MPSEDGGHFNRERNTSMINNNPIHFIFDSEHIDAIQTRLYGFYTTAAGMFTQVPSNSRDIADTTGPWVLVMRSRAGIEITQDPIGCFGLFLFQKGSYWALSNSFNHLLDYLKTRFELSLNKDYAIALLSEDHSVTVYGETIINEISWLDRRTQLHIDTETAELSFDMRHLEEKTVPIDSAEGLRILDTWHDKWASLVRGAAESWGGELMVDLSGGFDTRMVLAPVLSSGTDLSRIVFCSIPTLEEDYRIASHFAQEFGFRLNGASEPASAHSLPPIEPYAERAVTSIFFASRIREQSTQLPGAWQMIFKGSGGELSRYYWDGYSCSEIIKRDQKKLQEIHPFPETNHFMQSLESIVSRGFAEIETMLEKTGGEAGEIDGQRYYMETRNRAHFGMEASRRTLFGQCIQTPLLDPLMLKLRTPLDGSHPMLISALVYTRYHEQLAAIPFDRGRSIPKETLQMARELNRRYPRKPCPAVSQAPAVWQVIEVPDPQQSGDTSGEGGLLMGDRLIEAYESQKVWRNFAEVFGSTPDEWRESNPAKRHLNGDKYAAVSIAKVLDDIKYGKDACRDYAAFVEACRKEVAALYDSAGLVSDAGNDWNMKLKKQLLLSRVRAGLHLGTSDDAQSAMDERRLPRISVILPVCDAGDGIRSCIENLLEQTMRELEFIFIDDGSSDGAMAAVEFWAAHDARVRIFRSQERLDKESALKYGIEKAVGEYLAFMDPCDYITPHFFKVLYTAAVSGGGHDIAKGLGLHTNATGQISRANGRRLNDKLCWAVSHEKPIYPVFTTELHTAIYRRSLFISGKSDPLLLCLCRNTRDIVIDESALYTYAKTVGGTGGGRWDIFHKLKRLHHLFGRKERSQSSSAI